jgi:hypothetical protein
VGWWQWLTNAELGELGFQPGETLLELCDPISSIPAWRWGRLPCSHLPVGRDSAVGGCADGSEEFLWPAALYHIGDGAGSACCLARGRWLVHGQHDDAESGKALAERGGGSDAVEPRHRDIHEHDIGSELGYQLERFAR